MPPKTITIATRASALALWQAHHVRDSLLAIDPDLTIELLELTTQGDKILDVALSKVGGKALFVKEIEQALVDGRADVAVHSMKDVPAELAAGLHMAATSAREEPYDALLSRDGATLAELPQGARIGTSSLRRGAQLLAVRPDFELALLRGNVPTRVRKLDEGLYDAIVLAAAGLRRLGMGDRITEVLSPRVCLPAVGQGALGIETRADDHIVSALVRRAVHHEQDARRVIAERSCLARLGGSCQTPLAAFALYAADGSLTIEGLVAEPDGTRVLRAHRSGPSTDAHAIGEALADDLLAQGAKRIIDACEAS